MDNQTNPSHNYKINWSNVPSDFWKKVTEEDAAPQNLLNIDDETLQQYYSAAAQLLEEKKWSDAEVAFLFLAFLNPRHENFWLGLGIARQAQSKFEEACTAYLNAEVLNSSNPSIHINALQCYAALNNMDAAEQAYQKCIQACQHNPEHEPIKSQAIQLHDALMHKIR